MGREALEGTSLLHSGKARIEYHRVIAGGTLLHTDTEPFKPRLGNTCSEQHQICSESLAIVGLHGRPLRISLQRNTADRRADGHTQLFCARQQGTPELVILHHITQCRYVELFGRHHSAAKVTTMGYMDIADRTGVRRQRGPKLPAFQKLYRM